MISPLITGYDKHEVLRHISFTINNMRFTRLLSIVHKAIFHRFSQTSPYRTDKKSIATVYRQEAY